MNKLKTFLPTLILILVLLACMIAGVVFGAVNLKWQDFIQSDATGYYIAWHLRMPRVVLAVLSGGALAISGVILQAIMRNPLASPGIIGVSAGGGLGAICVILLLPEFANYAVVIAFAGALLTATGVYLLAWNGGIEPLRVVVSGVAFSSLLGALTGMVLLLNSDKVIGVLEYLSGSLNARNWESVEQIYWYVVLGIVVALLLHRSLDVLQLGDELAVSLGLPLERRRLLLLATASLLAAAVVSVTGVLGFVGLIAPHIARKLTKGTHLNLLINSGLMGAILVVCCDLIGRLIVSPQELPAGILLALLGAPFFLYLLRRSGKIYES